MRFVKINDLTMHYQLQGDAAGRPLVFINSLGTSRAIWDTVIDHLGPGFHSLTYDKRGHGLSDLGATPYRLDDHVGDLMGLLDHLRWQRVTLVGLSVGGMIAQQIAADHPDRVAALVLSDTAAKIGTAESWNARIQAVEAGGIEAIADAVMERWFSPVTHRDRPVEVLGARNMLTRIPRDGYAGTCAALRDADRTTRAPAIKAPTLCLAGIDDQSTPPDLVRATAALIPSARFQVIEATGHMPPLEQPRALAVLLRGFFTEVGLV